MNRTVATTALAGLAVATSTVALVAENSSVQAAQTSSTAARKDPVAAKPRHWKTLFRDDFAGAKGQALSTAKWIHDRGHCYNPCVDPNWGTGEIQNYTARRRNVSTDGKGHLAITPIRDGSGAWTSGRVETRRHDFAIGGKGRLLRIEARIKLPRLTTANGAGYWPAFWALGDQARTGGAAWPAVGEVDIMESRNGQGTTLGVLHCGVKEGGPCREKRGLRADAPCQACGAAFHTYAVEIDRSTRNEQIRYYVDGRRYLTLTPKKTGIKAWNMAMHRGRFLVLNVAIGGGFPGDPTAATASGRPMLVDYVVVKRRI
ncbi:family 16 glycosylhydrolase [Actinomadura barringtoniae]|uniref:Family 16 glycosylhydrolase n=1 Tax=Actinomadura barringtoniae TaxID=1427535 RepID=A0A939T4K3_9ACTN|nr:family 16 glycosylhydrolase [Actinomadura barringtoniae]MBO2448344.1 family 16 glycosylhydrolase [Actinomadura barringtoniae]